MIRNNHSPIIVVTCVLGVATALIAPVHAQTSGKSAAKTVKTESCCLPGAKKVMGKHDAHAKPVTMALSGLDCEGCATSIKSALQDIASVEEITVDVKAQKAVVWICPQKHVKTETLTAAIKRNGFTVVKGISGKPDTTKKKGKSNG